LLNFKIQGW